MSVKFPKNLGFCRIPSKESFLWCQCGLGPVGIYPSVGSPKKATTLLRVASRGTVHTQESHSKAISTAQVYSSSLNDAARVHAANCYSDGRALLLSREGVLLTNYVAGE